MPVSLCIIHLCSLSYSFLQLRDFRPPDIARSNRGRGPRRASAGSPGHRALRPAQPATRPTDVRGGLPQAGTV